MRQRWALLCVLGVVASCGSGGPAYLRVTVTCADPLVDLALVESLTVRWNEAGVDLNVDVPVGDVLRDGSTSFVLRMPGGVTVTGLTAEGAGPGGAVLATATEAEVVVPGSGTRDVTLALAPPAGPAPLTCSGGGAPTAFPTIRVTDAIEHSKAESVAWMGTGWAVSFGDARFNDPDKSRTDPMLALLAPDGTKLADEVRVDDGWCYAAASQIAWTGSRLALVWYDCSPSPEGENYDLMFRAFDASGVPLGPTKVLTQAVAQNENWRTGTLLWDGSRLVLASACLPGAGPEWRVVLWLLDEDGNLVDEPLPFASFASPDEPLPSLASSGSGYALGLDVKDGAASVGRLQLLSPGGHAAGAPIDIGVGSGLRVVWAGDRYVAGQVDATGTTPQLRLVSVGTDGAVGQPLLLPLHDFAGNTLPLASTGSDVGAAILHQVSETETGLALQRHAAWLAPLGGAAALREGAGAVSQLALGASPTGYGVAWSDDSAGNWEVFFATVGCP